MLDRPRLGVALSDEKSAARARARIGLLAILVVLLAFDLAARALTRPAVIVVSPPERHGHMIT